jgi:predicted transcriptional regulator
MARLTIRLADRLEQRLDTLAAEHGRSRAAIARELLEASVQGTPALEPETPTEDELLALLTEKARQGNVAAIRSLLLREEQKDPRHRALLAFEQIAGERRQ